MTYPAVVIGAGQAGVALSHCLQQRGVAHVVLERDRPFADWYRRRWDSFAMNTPNWMNRLPGESQRFAPDSSPNGYGTLADALEYFEAYRATVQPPIQIEQVQNVSENSAGDWQVVTDSATYRTRNLAICTGHASDPQLPAVAAQVPASVPQLHSSQYHRSEQIATSQVLVVGSGSSGVQICQELAASHRFANVYLAESGNFTLPWSVLGIPTYTLMRTLGVFKITRDSWLGRWMFPRLQKKGDPATPPSPRQLAREFGVRRVGRVESADHAAIHCGSGKSIASADLTILWCTGFRANYQFLDPAVRAKILGPDGFPRHHRGVATDASRLYFLGLRFQHTFISQDIGGIGPDARYLAEEISKAARAVK